MNSRDDGLEQIIKKFKFTFMSKKKIAVFDTKPYDKKFFNSINEDPKFGFELTFYKHQITIDNVVLAKDFDAICVFVNDFLTEDIINKLHEFGVKLIVLRSAGYNNVDLKAALKKLHVKRVPSYSPHTIAEHTVALMLTLNRKIHRAYFRTRDSNFALSGLLGFDMKGKTAGVIGTGKIGKALVEILTGMGLHVLTHDLYPDEEFASRTGCTYVELDTLYNKSDIISLNCPLTKETEYLINEKSIDKMKDGVMLINTGRGKLIKTSDLINGLKSGKIGHAGLDVYEEENEYFFEDLSDRVLNDDILARLLTFNNVIITSHQGFFTEEALHNIVETTLQNVVDFFDGKPSDNEVCYKCAKGEEDCQKKEGKMCFEEARG